MLRIRAIHALARFPIKRKINGLARFFTRLFSSTATTVICLSDLLSGSEKTAIENLEAVAERLAGEDSVLAIQVIAGNRDTILTERAIGIRSASDDSPIDADTQFCIGSCSKPISSAIILSIVQSNELDLDTPIDYWLSEFNQSRSVEGLAFPRAPNLRELLANRGGIYSQKNRMTRNQARWIRDFRLSLEESVKGIASEPLLSPPGQSYAYSGAGYCVLGRVTEVALDTSFEEILQSRIAGPLQLRRTTYFPDQDEPNIATGSLGGKPNKATPHLSQPFRLSLIGGSLYSTARDISKFLKMVVNQGRLGSTEILTPDSFQIYSKPHFRGRPYGLGWTLKIQNRKVVQLSHNGALASSRAAIKVNLQTGKYAAVLYTITDPRLSTEPARSLNTALSAFINAEE